MKIAVWCRHKDDNIIGIGQEIPWRIPSDFRRFRRLTEEKTLVVGKKTYESFPNKTLPNRRIIVLTSNAGYEVSDKQNHRVETNIKNLADFDGDLYIGGGAAVYEAFFADNALRPEIVVDCVYEGAMREGLTGQPATVDKSVEIMQQKYRQLPLTYEQDNVKTTVWVIKGGFVSQTILKEILTKLEQESK